MRLKTAAWLAAVAAVLTILNVAEAWVAARQRDAAAQNRLMVKLPATAVSSFTLCWRNGNKVGLAKSADGPWMLVNPADIASNQVVEEMKALVAFGQGKSQETVSPIVNPVATLEIIAKDGRAMLTFGEEDKGQRLLRVEQGNDAACYSIDSGLTRFLDREVEKFRELDLANCNPGNVAGITLEGGPDKKVIIERAGAGWEIRTPVAWPANDDTVNNLLRNCSELTALAVMADSAAKPEQFGFGEGSQSISLRTNAGVLVLRLAKPLEEKGQGIAMVDGRKPVFAVNDRLRQQVASLTGDACRRRWLDLLGRVQTLGSIEFKSPGSAIKLVRSAEGWSGISPVKFPADMDELQGLVNILENLPASRFIAEDGADNPDYNLATPAVSIIFYDNEGKEAAGLDIGGEAWQDERYARVRGKPQVFTLPTMFASACQRPWYAFYRRIICAFPLQASRSLTIWRDGVEYAYEKAEGDAWKCTKPKASPADAFGLLTGPLGEKGLGKLRAISFVSAAKEDIAKFGLDRPHLRVVVNFAPVDGPSEALDMEIGSVTALPAKDGGKDAGEKPKFGCYARIRGSDVVFLIDASVAQMLEKDYTDIPNRGG